MKAVVFHAVGDIRIEDVDDPRIEQPTDAIVRLTATAICGTDLHLVRGTFHGVEPGTILGHEGIGIVEQVGSMVRNVEVGDRVVIPSTIGCGSCPYCRAGDFSQCDNANPGGRRAGPAFFGGPAAAGGFDGLQAEKARVPFAHVNLVRLPDAISDDQAIMLSDIFPTGWFGADIADIRRGHIVAVFGCGPVGQFTICSARLMGAGRIIAVDDQDDRLTMARRQGSETINFAHEDPVGALANLTDGIGPDRIINVMGVDAEHAHAASPPARPVRRAADVRERHGLGPDDRSGAARAQSDKPSRALRWAVEAIAKAGTLSIVGVYPSSAEAFPIGAAMNKNLTIRMGNCNHRKYLPDLIELVRTGTVDPTKVLSQVEPPQHAIRAYEAFDARRPGWIKVALDPAA